MIEKKFQTYLPDREIFKNYLLRDFIGRGQNGVVYLVENRFRKRALKVFDKSDPGMAFHIPDDNLESSSLESSSLESSSLESSSLESFYKELFKGNLSHHIVDVLEFGRTVSREPCLLMEYLGESLSKILGQKNMLDIHESSHYFQGLLKGLAMHEKHGILHLNLKPSNIFLSGDTVKFSDHLHTLPSALLKPFKRDTIFFSPEAFEGERSHWVDRWAAAALLFLMISGEQPFPGDTATEIRYAIKRCAIKKNLSRLQLIPEPLHPFFIKSFQTKKEDRHQSAHDMLESYYSSVEVLLHASLFSYFPEKYLQTRHHIDIPQRHHDKQGIITAKYKNISLRNEPVTVSEDDFQRVFGLDEAGRPLVYIENRYEESKKGTIIDHATGLIWQQSGSEKALNHEESLEYIYSLNLNKFGGYGDWRIPTIAELISLVEKEKLNGNLYINPLFDHLQQWCWSADMRSSHSGWFLFYYLGTVYWDFFDLDNFVRAVRHNIS
ncbi:MAG: DUF1566 domain-containing protein [Desulfamplus sp.]|nr:DUF1566 domain-containing protein [Desulfamplus sp.]